MNYLKAINRFIYGSDLFFCCCCSCSFIASFSVVEFTFKNERRKGKRFLKKKTVFDTRFIITSSSSSSNCLREKEKVEVNFSFLYSKRSIQKIND